MTPAGDWKEVITEGEAERFEALAAQLRELQRKRATQGEPGRALHSKGCIGARAELSVLPGLPAHARAGPFATEQTYPAYVRFSNGSARRASDTKPDTRGMAVKLLGVGGTKLIPGLEDATTQDFLGIQFPSSLFPGVDDLVWFVSAAEKPALFLPRAIIRFGPVGAMRLISSLLKQTSRPVTSVAVTSYYSALPIKFGSFAVHYVFRAQAPPDPVSQPGKSADYLRDELAARLKREPVVYDLCVQFFVDEDRTPIEDPVREWKESDAPFVAIARLTIPKQDLDSAHGRRIAQYVEELSFDPWHACEDLRPIGSMMRARNVAYKYSAQQRGAAPEPVGTRFID